MQSTTFHQLLLLHFMFACLRISVYIGRNTCFYTLKYTEIHVNTVINNF